MTLHIQLMGGTFALVKALKKLTVTHSNVSYSGGPGGPGGLGAAVPRPVAKDGSPGLGNVIHQIAVMVTPVNLKNVTVDLVAVVQVSIHYIIILYYYYSNIEIYIWKG